MQLIIIYGENLIIVISLEVHLVNLSIWDGMIMIRAMMQ